MAEVLQCLQIRISQMSPELWDDVVVSLPEDVVTVTVVVAEDDVTVEDAAGIGTGSGVFIVEETVTVVWLEADDESEVGALEAVDEAGVAVLETMLEEADA